MYHRYLRNEQGEYRRQTVPDPPRQPQAAPPSTKPVPPPLSPSQPPEPDLKRHREEANSAPAPDYGIPFLGKLFPGMDQGDLLLLLIMLLLLSEGNEDANAMAMTLAIYLFLQ